MYSPPLRLTAICRGSHVEVVALARDALNSTRASILSCQMFSNAILCLNFEISRVQLGALANALVDARIRLDAGSLAAIEQVAGTEDDDGAADSPGAARVEGSLSINLINDEPALRIEVPAVPG